MKYYPQGVIDIEPSEKRTSKGRLCQGNTRFNATNKFSSIYGKRPSQKEIYTSTKTGYPADVLYFDALNSNKRLHPTQKPTDLLEYLIKTYTNEGEVVLDATIGSGSTAVAAINTNRHFIGFEIDKKYFDIANERIERARQALV